MQSFERILQMSGECKSRPNEWSRPGSSVRPDKIQPPEERGGRPLIRATGSIPDTCAEQRAPLAEVQRDAPRMKESLKEDIVRTSGNEIKLSSCSVGKSRIECPRRHASGESFSFWQLVERLLGTKRSRMTSYGWNTSGRTIGARGEVGCRLKSMRSSNRATPKLPAFISASFVHGYQKKKSGWKDRKGNNVSRKAHPEYQRPEEIFRLVCATLCGHVWSQAVECGRMGHGQRLSQTGKWKHFARQMITGPGNWFPPTTFLDFRYPLWLSTSDAPVS